MSLKALQPDALSKLRDIHLPPAVSWWPPAPGWWVLLLLGCLLLPACWYGWRRFHMRHRQPTQKALLAAAMRELADLDKGIRAGDPAAMASLSSLMRRVAVQLDGEAAGLTGDAWLQWLDSRWQRHDFTAGASLSLSEAPYRPISAADAARLSGLCREWLEAQQ